MDLKVRFLGTNRVVFTGAVTPKRRRQSELLGMKLSLCHIEVGRLLLGLQGRTSMCGLLQQSEFSL